MMAGFSGFAEVEVVGCRKGRRAGGDEVAVGLGHGLLAAFIGVGLHIAGRDVRGEGDGLGCAVDADDACAVPGARAVSPMTM